MEWPDILTGLARLESARRGISPDQFEANQALARQNTLVRGRIMDILTNGDEPTKRWYTNRIAGLPLTLDESLDMVAPTGPGATNNGGAPSVGGVGDAEDSGVAGGQPTQHGAAGRVADYLRTRLGPGVGASYDPKSGIGINMPAYPPKPLAVPYGAQGNTAGYPTVMNPPTSPEAAVFGSTPGMGGGQSAIGGPAMPGGAPAAPPAPPGPPGPPGRPLTPPGARPAPGGPPAPTRPSPVSPPGGIAGLGGAAERLTEMNYLKPIPSEMNKAQGIKNAWGATKDLDAMLRDPAYDVVTKASTPIKAAMWKAYKHAGGLGIQQLAGLSTKDPVERDQIAAKWLRYLRTTGYLNGTGAAPLLNGIRRGDLVQDIKVHLGTPWDEYGKLVESRDALMAQYPYLLAEIPVGSGGAALSPLEDFPARLARANHIADQMPPMTLGERAYFPGRGGGTPGAPAAPGGRQGRAASPLTPQQQHLFDQINQ